MDLRVQGSNLLDAVSPGIVVFPLTGLDALFYAPLSPNHNHTVPKPCQGSLDLDFEFSGYSVETRAGAKKRFDI